MAESIAERITEYDGQTYKPGDKIPDLGSLVCVSTSNGRRNYEGKLIDYSKLPTYVQNGSSALLYDGSGNTEVYHFLHGEWMKI